MPKLINCTAGDAILAGQYFRAAFEPSFWLNSPTRAPAAVYGALRNGDVPYATPVNQPEVMGGDPVFVLDIRAFQTAETVGRFAGRLDELSVWTSLRSLERVTELAVYGPAGMAARAVVQQKERETHEEESLTHKLGVLLKDLGWVVLVILALMLLLIAHKAYREVAP